MSKPQPKLTLAIFAGLFFVSIFAYLPAASADFVNFDDPDYVTANTHVRQGLTVTGVEWALTSGDAANWFPLTRISHMLDVQLFGIDAPAHHRVNIFLHACATLLLFAFLLRATRAIWPSAFVAAVFALHPLHVESVAWIAERKDVLSALFWFLTFWLYVRYTEKPGAARYVWTLVAFALGLMAKPMIVTLPFVLVLLDWWPLRRWTKNGPRILAEKLPFFALSAIVAAVTFLVQRGSGAIADAHPLSVRIENAIVSYAIYIQKTFWPSSLAVFYPYPANIAVWQVVAAAVFIVAISFFVCTLRRSRPYLLVGWLWFLVTLIPVIGLVQAGAQARADRYMYVPMVGLAIMLAWGAADLVPKFPSLKTPIAAMAGIACVSMTALTMMQSEVWANSGRLFQHAIDSGAQSDIAFHNLGNYLAETGKTKDAITQYEIALSINQNSARTQTDLGNALSQDPNRLTEAVVHYEAALRLGDYAITRNNLANTLAKMGRMPEAIAQYEASLRLDPDYEDARRNLEAIHMQYAGELMNSRRAKQAVPEYEAVLKLDPNSAQAHNNLGIALTQIPARAGEAIGQFALAVKLDPQYANARVNLGIALAETGRREEAIEQFEQALRINPDPEVQRTLDELRRQK